MSTKPMTPTQALRELDEARIDLKHQRWWVALALSMLGLVVGIVVGLVHILATWELQQYTRDTLEATTGCVAIIGGFAAVCVLVGTVGTLGSKGRIVRQATYRHEDAVTAQLERHVQS